MDNIRDCLRSLIPRKTADSDESRGLYRLILYEGTDISNRDHLQNELDAFWTYGPKILEMKSRGQRNGQIYRIKADPGFDEVWKAENELDIRSKVEKIEKVSGGPLNQ